jgi:hypothetical protein
MDPYLERSSSWPEVHHALVTYARDDLQGQVGPSYYVAIERRLFVLDELEVREAYLEVRALDGDRVVTVIEFVSPANKHAGRGREEYLRKQARVLASEANLVEVDLLGTGAHTVAVPVGALHGAPYCAVVSRARDRHRRGLYRFGLRDPLPRVAVPLRDPEPDATLDLGALLARAYETGAYARRVDYSRDPAPPLAPADAAWARTLLPG